MEKAITNLRLERGRRRFSPQTSTILAPYDIRYMHEANPAATPPFRRGESGAGPSAGPT
jgi:hypothetical protein